VLPTAKVASPQPGVLSTSLLIDNDLGSAQDPVMNLVARLQAVNNQLAQAILSETKSIRLCQPNQKATM
jgi:hypothetical protein